MGSNPRLVKLGVHCKSLMAKWLARVSQWHEVYCHDLDVMGSNLSRVEILVSNTSI